VLFEMLTGRVPYDGDEPVEVAWQHVDNDVPAPSSIVKGLPTVLDDLVAGATRRDPGARPTDAGALLAEVQVVRDDLGAANVETALLRQVPARPPAADATALVPAITTTFPATGGDRPGWARLPEQGRTRGGQRRAGPPPPRVAGGLLGRFSGDRRQILIMAAVALMVLVVVGSTWWVTLGRYTDTPQLVNMSRAQAEQAAAQEGFELRIGDGAFSENVPKDVVLSQDPAPTERILKGGVVSLTLSLGPERYPVPDVIGKELAVARGEIEGTKLKVKEGKGKYSDTIPQGVVISTDPKADAQLKPGSTVTVVVSKGKAPITVPDFSGKNINDARSEAQRLGLAVVEQYKEDNRPTDQIIGQSPGPGTGAEKDDEIKLVVSKGPPQVGVPDVNNQPCQQAKGVLESQGLRARLDFNPNGVVRIQNPPAGTPVPPQTEVVLTCA
jgi:beta-lactam-binding protein with PASTA domain